METRAKENRRSEKRSKSWEEPGDGERKEIPMGN